MADSVGSTESAWGWLQDGLKQVGMTVLEAGNDYISDKLDTRDRITASDEPEPKLTQYQQPVTVDGQAIPREGAFMGTLRSINPTHALMAVAALGGLLFLSKVVK